MQLTNIATLADVGPGGLQPVRHVEDDLALADLDLEAGERAGARVRQILRDA
jgi:hypothetical protein